MLDKLFYPIFWFFVFCFFLILVFAVFPFVYRDQRMRDGGAPDPTAPADMHSGGALV